MRLGSLSPVAGRYQRGDPLPDEPAQVDWVGRRGNDGSPGGTRANRAPR